MHKTSAWPLSLLYGALLVWASLFPFDDWRDQGGNWLAYLWQPLPQYWTGFDVWTNVLGYVPFGFLLCVGAVRAGLARPAVLLAVLTGACVALVMETLQVFLPTRVPSNLDWALNVAGTAAGALLARLLERAGALARWSRLRQRWFVSEARGGLVLLALWPLALLFPSPVPLGLGQVLGRLEGVVAETLDGTPFLGWLPVRDQDLQVLLPGAEFVCVFLGLLIPCLLAFCIVNTLVQRLVAVAGLVTMGLLATTLSAALSFGPEYAWDWLGLPVQAGLACACVLALLMSVLPRRVDAALAILALGVFLAVLNQAPVNPYFAENLHSWEQGRFIRFNGLAQWLGWLWPYAALVYLLTWVGAKKDPQ